MGIFPREPSDDRVIVSGAEIVGAGGLVVILPPIAEGVGVAGNGVFLVAVVIIGVGILLGNGAAGAGLDALAGEATQIVIGIGGDFAAALGLGDLAAIQCVEFPEGACRMARPAVSWNQDLVIRRR